MRWRASLLPIAFEPIDPPKRQISRQPPPATEPVGYVHMVGVRTSARRQGFAGELFEHFAEFARRHGCRQVKAITTPSNLGSIAFHKSLGMQLLGEANLDGIPVLPDYAGRGAPRVVFWKSI